MGKQYFCQIAVFLSFRCEMEPVTIPMNGKGANLKPPIPPRKASCMVLERKATKRSKVPTVQIALRCPKDQSCEFSASDSDGSTGYGSITNLLSHEVSTRDFIHGESCKNYCGFLILLIIIWYISSIFSDVYIHDSNTIFFISVGDQTHNKGKLASWAVTIKYISA